eukprot:13260392-Ditylum_brightwellii.AAC.1
MLTDLPPPRPITSSSKGDIRRSGPVFEDVVDVSKAGILPSQPHRVLPTPNKNDPSLLPESLLRRRRKEGKNGKSRKSGGRESGSCVGGPLMKHELKQLALLCASLSSSSIFFSSTATVSPDGGSSHILGGGDQDVVFEDNMAGWAEVDGDSLSTLTQMLEMHVTSASHVDIIGGARFVLEYGNGESEKQPKITIEQWLSSSTSRGSDSSATCNTDAEPGRGFQRFSILRRGLEAAAILLSIMTNPGIDKRAVSDDAVESCISLMKQHLQRNVVPAISHTGHGTSESSRDTSDSTVAGKGPNKKKQKRSSNQDVLRGLKKVYKPILATVGPLSILMEKMEQLIRSVHLDDQPILTICASVLSTLSLEPVAPTQ